MKRAYYNEIDPYAAQWLRNLISAGHIAPGDVDERSIADVKADDLAGYAQCHFFAGIGGWSIALRLAGFSDDRPVWTGSCPCQPFSSAGKGKAADDERHLWPAWLPLIAERRPAIVFGEQVEAAIGWGWLDAVFADLEREGYACGAAVLPACGIGAPHIRQRVWFVADADGRDAGAERPQRGGQQRLQPQDGGDGVLADAYGDGGARQLHDCSSERWGVARADVGNGCDPGELGDAASDEQRRPWFPGSGDGRQGAARGSAAWSHCEWLPCTDGKARPVEPGSFPLAHGVLRRPSKLRAYGNAIVPQIAAEFIAAATDRTMTAAAENPAMPSPETTSFLGAARP